MSTQWLKVICNFFIPILQSRFQQKITKLAKSEKDTFLYAADQIGYIHVYNMETFAAEEKSPRGSCFFFLHLLLIRQQRNYKAASEYINSCLCFYLSFFFSQLKSSGVPTPAQLLGMWHEDGSYVTLALFHGHGSNCSCLEFYITGNLNVSNYSSSIFGCDLLL